ncbi:MAG: GHKL domain-containing protein [Pseudothermotoga sp.]|uniref:ATP-binding protein n=1 Tax=Pseudothermotoga sp. TaxID=2033661 RepID=UPI000E809671|nr:GHKL domain-containing protein [Pseudothermotoga sp.]HBT38652.1 sensor histidine kinase [Pseudothermotoga sp.]HCO98165.1 sensor histidine kinase [Pseudothermotoga sp.]
MNATEPDLLLDALMRIFQRFVDCERIVVLGNDLNVKKIKGGTVEIDEELKKMVQWVVDKHSPMSLPTGDAMIHIFPLVKAGKTLGVLLAWSKEEIVVETSELLRTFAFLSAVVLENLELYSSLQRQHKALKATKNYMQRILDSFPQHIAVFDQDSRIVFANKGYSLSTFGEDFISQVLQLVQKTFLTGSRQMLEVEEGANFYSIVAELIEYEGQPQVLLVITDVTNTKEVERLKAIDRLKTEFVANISHELKTPLAAIKAYAETILTSIEMLDQQTLNEFVQIIYRESEHLESILEGLLDFSKLEQRMLTLEKTTFDLTGLVRETMRSIEELARSKQVRLELLTREPVLIRADQRRIKQVITNLLSNGIKYSKEDSQEKYVKVKIERKDGKVLIEISDNGLGIPKEYQEKVFERFFRVGTVMDHRVDGTGLGLTIAKQIVELHGGRIWLESEPNVGTTVFVELPVGDGQ